MRIHKNIEIKKGDLHKLHNSANLLILLFCTIISTPAYYNLITWTKISVTNCFDYLDSVLSFKGTIARGSLSF